jgi:uncharacterized membrane protein
MLSLLFAAIFFVLLHVAVAVPALRDGLIARLGPGPYRGLFALASLGGVVWLCLAYDGAPVIATWGPLIGLKPVALAGMLVAVGFVVLGLTTPSPTAVGGEAVLARAPAPVGIQRITRHPFLWGVALWAALHLAVNGDLASLLLFGALGLVALLGTASIDRKRRRALGAAWGGFAAATSNLPFLAIAQGRARPGLDGHRLWQWLAVLAAFAALLALHAPLFGVSPLPG